jgi:hypothetical protein
MFALSWPTHALQYWLVHHGKVDVPSMYRPYGRYRYVGGVVSPMLSHAEVLDSSKGMHRTGELRWHF